MVGETAAVIDPANPMSRRGLYNLDPSRKGFGYGVDGAMTRFVRVPARLLHAVPDALPFEHACLTEPCCVAYNAVVKNARVEAGDRVVVLGPGTIGILCAAVARLCGAEVALVGLESDRHRLKVAGGRVRLRDDRRRCERLGAGAGRPRLRRGDRRGGHQCHARRGPRAGPPGRLDQQGRLGPAAAGRQPGPARAEEYHPAGQFQSQLAGVGNGCSRCWPAAGWTWPRSSAGSGRSPNGTRPSRRCTAARWSRRC